MNRIRINGQTISISGSDIYITGGRISVDGHKIKNYSIMPDKEVHIIINGDVNALQVNYCDTIEVKGNVNGYVKTGGAITVEGDIYGNAHTENSLHCRYIGRDAHAGNSIHCDNIQGDAIAGNNIHHQN